ncbi:MAG: cytochrome P460 family protein [Terriglobia bacterium]
MKLSIAMVSLVLISICAASLVVPKPAPPADLLQYANGDELVRPQDYREWVFISSGFRLSNNPSPAEGATFTNVFVNPSAYKQFLTTGNWPDKTVLVEEKRTSSNKGSLNKTSQFQTELLGVSVKVKDAARFPDKWAYFSFGASAQTAHANPKAACWQCHHDHGAVDSTYVQFYPTLKPVAQKFGTLHEAATGAEAY